MGFGGGSGGGGGTISGAGDTALSSPVEAHVLTYNGTTSKWTNRVVPAGAKGDPGDVTIAVGAGGSTTWSGTINASVLNFPATYHRTVTGNVTLSALPAPDSAVSGTLSLVLKLSSSATGNYTITWPSSVYTDASQDVSFTTTAGNFTIYHLFWTGSKWTLTKQGDYDFS